MSELPNWLHNLRALGVLAIVIGVLMVIGGATYGWALTGIGAVVFVAAMGAQHQT